MRSFSVSMLKGEVGHKNRKHLIKHIFGWFAAIFLLLLLISALGVRIPFLNRLMVIVLSVFGFVLGLFSMILYGLLSTIMAFFSSITSIGILFLLLFKLILRAIAGTFIGKWIKSTRTYKRFDWWLKRTDLYWELNRKYKKFVRKIKR